MADLGIEGLVPGAQRIGLEQVAHLDEEGLKRFGDSAQANALRDRLKNFEGLPATDLPATVQAEMRPYQKDGQTGNECNNVSRDFSQPGP